MLVDGIEAVDGTTKEPDQLPSASAVAVPTVTAVSEPLFVYAIVMLAFALKPVPVAFTVLPRLLSSLSRLNVRPGTVTKTSPVREPESVMMIL